MLDNDKHYPILEDEFNKYVIDSNNNLYLGSIDTSIDYDADYMPYYWWCYEKLGHVKQFLDGSKAIKIVFVGDIFAYPEQILDAPDEERCV